MYYSPTPATRGGRDPYARGITKLDKIMLIGMGTVLTVAIIGTIVWSALK